MGKNLYLHVGHFKTGTTALQTFLSQNPGFLAKNDLLYCSSMRNLAKHSALAFSLYRAVGVKELMHGYRKDVSPEDVWEEVLEEVRKAPQSRAIVSTEEFMRMGSHPEAAELLSRILANAPDMDVRVIAYLREPSAHLHSWYNQLVKMGIPTPSFNTAAPAMMEAVHYDFALAMKPWVDLVGPENVILRAYPGRRNNGEDLFTDFLSIFGLKLPVRGIKLPAGDPNPRFDDRVVELKRVLNNSGMQDAVIGRIIDRAQRYFEAECAGLPNASEQDFAGLQQQSRDGLNALAEMLPDGSTQVAALRGHLPERTDPGDADSWRMAGLLLSEIAQLRKGIARTTRELDQRLQVLEEAQDRQGRD